MGTLAANDELFAYYRRLHARGIRLAICTNNVREWEPLWRAKLPIDEIFETVVDSAFVGVRKPDPAIYAHRARAPRARRRPSARSSTTSRSNVRGRARSSASRACTSTSTEQAIAELDALLATGVDAARAGHGGPGGQQGSGRRSCGIRRGGGVASVVAAEPVPDVELEAFRDQLLAAGARQPGQDRLERLLLRDARVERVLPAQARRRSSAPRAGSPRAPRRR